MAELNAPGPRTVPAVEADLETVPAAARSATAAKGLLAGQVGRLLQGVRGRSGLSQDQLAERAGTSQQWVSRVERGAVNLRLCDAERLFAVTGTRLAVQTVRIGDEVTADPDLLSRGEVTDVLRVVVSEFSYLLRQFGAVPYVIGGRIAALAQGMPVRPGRLDLVIGAADVEGARSALAMCSTLRWSDRHQDFRGYDKDVARPGERRWSIGGMSEVSIDVVAELPVPLVVAGPETELPVVPLVTLLSEDPDIAELARRLAG